MFLFFLSEKWLNRSFIYLKFFRTFSIFNLRHFMLKQKNISTDIVVQEVYYVNFFVSFINMHFECMKITILYKEFSMNSLSNWGFFKSLMKNRWNGEFTSALKKFHLWHLWKWCFTQCNNLLSYFINMDLVKNLHKKAPDIYGQHIDSNHKGITC